MRTNPKLLLPIVGLFVAIPLFSRISGGGGGPTSADSGNDDPGAIIVVEAMRSQVSGVVVETSGVVAGITVADPTSSEQRFLVRLTPDVTVQVLHEIRAAAIPLSVGDRIRVRGRFMWTPEGGLIGETQDALEQDRPGGWVLHEGVFYPPHDGWMGLAGDQLTDE